MPGGDLFCCYFIFSLRDVVRYITRRVDVLLVCLPVREIAGASSIGLAVKISDLERRVALRDT